MPRRTAITAGATGLLGLSLSKLFAAEEAQPVNPAIRKRAGRAKSIIFLYQFGGPSHVDTFDMKPNAPEGIRSLFGQIDSAIPGVRICEHLPQTAKILDKVTLVRTVFHSMKNHNSAAYHALTGHAPPVDDIRLKDSIELFPAYGSVVDRIAPNAETMPTFVSLPHIIRDGSVTPGQHASFLGKRHDPLLITADPNDSGFKLPELSLPSNLSADRLQSRREMQRIISQQTRLLEHSATARGIDEYYDRTGDVVVVARPRCIRSFARTGEDS